MKKLIKRIPILGSLANKIYNQFKSKFRKPAKFSGSHEYWEKRYHSGGNSGAGSYTKFATFKADVINRFVSEHNVKTIIEFGCGDGNQLKLSAYPEYIGFDVSETAIALCRKQFSSDPTKMFLLMNEFKDQTADLTLSLDVLYHLVEDRIFESYMNTLFKASNQYVVIYSSDTDNNAGYEGTHVRHRRFTEWVSKNLPLWKIIRHIPNKYPYKGDYREGSFADFYIYKKS